MPEPGDPFWDEFETEEMIMEATVWVLAEEGYPGLTLRKVAERAGKNRGLVHYYFESKDDLLRSLLDHIHEGMQRLIGISEEDSPLEQLWTALNFFAYGPEGFDEHGWHYYLAISQLQALAAYDSELRKQFTRNHQYRIDLLAGIIKEGIRDETFHPADPEATAIFLIAAIEGAQNADLSLDVETARNTTLEIIDQFLQKNIIK
jgi:AcrR family transcriptional regulator